MSILSRLTRLEHQPGNKVPHFIVETVYGGTMTVYGYGLLAVPDVRRVHFDPTQLCAQMVIDLFAVLCPEADICPEN